MKKLTFLFLLLSGALFGQGTLKETLKIKSAVLGKDVEYSLYLPPDYEQSNRRYPVLYLLHGYSDDETGWTQFGEVKAIADAQLQKGEMTATIIAMPDAGVSWYVNSADGKVKFEEFFVKEFIPHIDATLRTRSGKQFRAVAGLSMGGYGSCLLALKHPDLFSAAAPLSAGIFTDQEVIDFQDEAWNNVLGPPYGSGLKGKDRLTAHYQANSILNLVLTGDAEEMKKVRYYIDCGDDDFLIKGNMALHAALIDKKVPHEFRVRDGGHTWTYWRTALPEVFRFISESFHR
ncbi:MAG: esterase family protein [Cyclobacteriaceae bacterium]|nr:esterase family protein [Cyclobacteriaceae bacterium]